MPTPSTHTQPVEDNTTPTLPSLNHLGPFSSVPEIHAALTFGFENPTPSLIDIIEHVKDRKLETGEQLERSHNVRQLLRRPNYLFIERELAVLGKMVLNCTCTAFEKNTINTVDRDSYVQDPTETVRAAVKEYKSDIIYLKSDQHEPILRATLKAEFPEVTVLTLFDRSSPISVELASSRVDIMVDSLFIKNELYDAILAVNLGVSGLERLKLDSAS